MLSAIERQDVGDSIKQAEHQIAQLQTAMDPTMALAVAQALLELVKWLRDKSS
jgi:hypothetical protein